MAGHVELAKNEEPRPAKVTLKPEVPKPSLKSENKDIAAPVPPTDGMKTPTPEVIQEAAPVISEEPKPAAALQPKRPMRLNNFAVTKTGTLPSAAEKVHDVSTVRPRQAGITKELPKTLSTAGPEAIGPIQRVVTRDEKIISLAATGSEGEIFDSIDDVGQERQPLSIYDRVLDPQSSLPEPEDASPGVYVAEDSQAINLDIFEAIAPASQELVTDEAVELEIPVQQWFPAAMETLEPEQIEAVEPILATIVELVQELRLLEDVTEPETQQEIIIQRQALEEWTVRLLEQLQIEPNETRVLQLVELMTAPQFSQEIIQKLTIRELNEQGTHEYKLSGLLGALNDLLQDIKQKFHWLGRYSLSLHLELAILRA